MVITLYKTEKYSHHKPFQKPSHSHVKGSAAGGSKKTGTREIKVVRKVLDVNDAIADQNRNMFGEKGFLYLM